MSTKLSKAQQQAIVFLTTKQREAETLRDTVMQDNPDFNFDRARSVYVGTFSKTTVEKLIELGLVEYTFTKSMIALIHDEQPEPEPPAPALPTASIGETGRVERIDMTSEQRILRPHNKLIIEDRNGLAEVSYNGVTKFFADVNNRYEVEFFAEHSGFMTHVVMYVNRKIHKVTTLQKRAKGGYSVFSYTIFENGVETEMLSYNHPYATPFLKDTARNMLDIFRAKLIVELANVTPETVATVTVMEKPKAKVELSFAIGDIVVYKGKQCPITHILENGAGNVPYIGIKAPYATKKGSSNTIIFRPASEFAVSLQAVA